MLSEDEKNDLITEIKTRISNITCPMCQNKHFTIADGYFNNFLQDNFQNLNLGGRSVPTIGIVCQKCGFVSQHALGILGKLPNLETDEPK